MGGDAKGLAEANRPMVEARGLARTFQTRTGPVEAVAGVDFAVAAREIVGFLGPNGAGKTTTQRMLSTLLAPTAGEATVAGCDLRRDPVGVRRQIGYVAQSGGTNPRAQVDEELVLQAQLYGLSTRGGRTAGRRDARRASISPTSAGARSRRCRAGRSAGSTSRSGSIHAPKLVFLDEPSTGLDPQSRANLWRHIRGLRDELGATIFLTTHYLDEADALCDRILIIDHGKIVAEGTPDRAQAADLRRSGGRSPSAASAKRARGLLAAQPGVRESAEHRGGRCA